MIKKIICIFKNHVFVPAGECPYTGKTYKVCTRCTKVIALL